MYGIRKSLVVIKKSKMIYLYFAMLYEIYYHPYSVVVNSMCISKINNEMTKGV